MKHLAFFLLVILSNISLGQVKGDLLRNELLEIYKSDQSSREQLSKIGPSDKDFMQLWRKQTSIDSINLLRIIAIIDSVGYPGKSMVGDIANEAAFYVIQHAEHKDREKYLPVIKKAADNGDLAWKHVAKMIDRIKVDRGEKQIYGTQMIPIKDPKTGFITDKYQFAPIEALKNINKRRLQVGLNTIEEQAKEFGVTYKE